MKKIKLICLSLVLVLLFSCFMCSCGMGGSVSTESGAETSSEQKKDDSAEKINAVIESIDKIGAVTVKSKSKIEDAKDLYKALTTEQKAKVTNYSKLEKAESEYKKLAEAEKEKLVKQYKSKFDVEHDKVENITWYYPKNMPEYIDTRCYLIPYIGVQGDNAWICVRYNYTEDDWIFWKKLTIVVDGEKFTKTVGSFNTVRDNDGGVVWEWYDHVLNVNQAMDSSEIKMLKSISKSDETIVRFEGDEYYYDLTVSSKDKSMIKDVLKMYDALVSY